MSFIAVEKWNYKSLNLKNFIFFEILRVWRRCQFDAFFVCTYSTEIVEKLSPTLSPHTCLVYISLHQVTNCWCELTLIRYCRILRYRARTRVRVGELCRIFSQAQPWDFPFPLVKFLRTLWVELITRVFLLIVPISMPTPYSLSLILYKVLSRKPRDGSLSLYISSVKVSKVMKSDSHQTKLSKKI